MAALADEIAAMRSELNEVKKLNSDMRKKLRSVLEMLRGGGKYISREAAATYLGYSYQHFGLVIRDEGCPIRWHKWRHKIYVERASLDEYIESGYGNDGRGI